MEGKKMDFYKPQAMSFCQERETSIFLFGKTAQMSLIFVQIKQRSTLKWREV